MKLLFRKPIRLSAYGTRRTSIPLPLGRLTDQVGVLLKRPTAMKAGLWGSADRLEVRFILGLGHEEYRCVGRATGGVKIDRFGKTSLTYALKYGLPWGFFGERDGPARRLGETSEKQYRAWVEFVLLEGVVETEFEILSREAPAPPVRFRSSVAFDTATDAQEAGGDGVLSLSHTAGGSDRAAFVGVGNSAAGGGSLGVATYGGTGMTELWDATFGSFYAHAGYSLAGVAASAQTVTSDLTAATRDEHALGVITMTGVDQTTPVGTAATATGLADAGPTVTVGSVGADDLVCASVYYHDANTGGALGAVGADQTERTREVFTASDNITHSTSTQPGTAGGVMSWSPASGTPGNGGWGIGGVAFKAVTGVLDPALIAHRPERLLLRL